MKPSKNTKKLMGLDTPKAATPEQPKYDSGVKYDSGAHYAAGDPTPPVNDGGVVKFPASSMTDSEITEFTGKENQAMTDNPNYEEPSPSVAEVDAANTDLKAKMQAMDLAQSMAKDATAARDAARLKLESLMKARASYVQLTSNGNTQLILNAGFPVRNPRTPVGVLPPPQNLRIDLSGIAGQMSLRWDSVPYARAYLVQISPADTAERNWVLDDTVTATRLLCNNMTLGQSYAFRIASVGGAAGQSQWSPEVVRMAA